MCIRDSSSSSADPATNTLSASGIEELEGRGDAVKVLRGGEVIYAIEGYQFCVRHRRGEVIGRPDEIRGAHNQKRGVGDLRHPSFGKFRWPGPTKERSQGKRILILGTRQLQEMMFRRGGGAATAVEHRRERGGEGIIVAEKVRTDTQENQAIDSVGIGARKLESQASALGEPHNIDRGIAKVRRHRTFHIPIGLRVMRRLGGTVAQNVRRSDRLSDVLEQVDPTGLVPGPQRGGGKAVQ